MRDNPYSLILMTDVHQYSIVISHFLGEFGMSVFKLFEELDNQENFKLDDLWMHSCGVAIATETLAERFESKLS